MQAKEKRLLIETINSDIKGLLNPSDFLINLIMALKVVRETDEGQWEPVDFVDVADAIHHLQSCLNHHKHKIQTVGERSPLFQTIEALQEDINQKADEKDFDKIREYLKSNNKLNFRKPS